MGAVFHTFDRTFHKCPDHIQIILFSNAALRSTIDVYSYFANTFMSTDTSGSWNGVGQKSKLLWTIVSKMT
jgi:hypothetical protein